MAAKLIYLDNHASTACAPMVIDAMLPYFSESYANPSSSFHQAGRMAAEAVDRSREAIAASLGVSESEIVFTSGATESNNLAILGVCTHALATRRRIVTSVIEHKSVLESCRHLATTGFNVTVLPVDKNGLVDTERLKEVLTDDTLLVSIQAANNEIGTIQSVEAIGAITRSRGVLFHCDAAQAFGRIPLDLSRLEVDMVSVSAHKICGPKGIGALYLRGGVRSQPIAPIVFGGGQEQGLRSGTLNVPGIIGFAAAARLATESFLESGKRMAGMRDLFEKLLIESFPETRRNGYLGNRLPGNASLTFPGIDAEMLLANIPEVAMSKGSACIGDGTAPSHVLLAIGLSREDASSTVRVGIGGNTTEAEIRSAAAMVVGALRRLRALTRT